MFLLIDKCQKTVQSTFIFTIISFLLDTTGSYPGFFRGGGEIKKISGGGSSKKHFFLNIKICLYSFLLGFYESDKHFGGGEVKLPPPPDTAMYVG